MRERLTIFYNVILSIFFLHGCCNCEPDERIEDPCGKECRDDQICLDGQCACPKGQINFGYRCLTINENMYKGYVGSCYCFAGSIIVDAQKQNFSTQNNYTVNVYSEEDGAWPTSNGFYRVKSDGDSILVYDFDGNGCVVKGVYCFAYFTGKFLGTDTLKGRIVWHPPGNPFNKIDSCELTMVKPII